MDNPVLVEVRRGALVESGHRGRLAIVDADGRVVLALGDVAEPVFGRSAVKALQALPLVESGIADRLGLTPAEIALACASHNGEALHVSTARAMLAKAGRDDSVLECGVQWPERRADVAALDRACAQPGAIHNNCSGKHAGFVCLACGLGVDPKGYVAAAHPVQEAVRAALSDVTETRLDADNRGTDGCSIPTYAIPLRNLAHGFAKFVTGEGLAPERAQAARRIRAAVAKHPFMVAGTNRFCTGVMEAFGERAFVKTGAEGVFCAAFPESGFGVALKIDDGGTRASEAVMATVAERMLGDASRKVLSRWANAEIRNRNGWLVGSVTAGEGLTGALADM